MSPVWLAAVGDVTDPATFSGTPYHCLQAGLAAGVFTGGLELKTTDRVWMRRRVLWNIWQILTRAQQGGYQYSEAFLDRLWRQTDEKSRFGCLLNFFQLFPQAIMRRQALARWFYIDQTLEQLFEYYDFAEIVPKSVRRDAIAREQAQYAAADGVICHSAWAAQSVRNEYGINDNRVHVVSYGANLDLNLLGAWEDVSFARPTRREGPLRAVFVGKEWKRKGLDRLLRAMRIARGRGAAVTLLVLGLDPMVLPADLACTPGVTWGGFVSKRKDPDRFIELLSKCDLGCLLSRAEAGGMSLREFCRLGLPTIAPNTGGNPEFVVPGATHLVAPEAPDDAIADILVALATDLDLLERQREIAWAARRDAGWDRAVINSVKSYVVCLSRVSQLPSSLTRDRKVTGALSTASRVNSALTGGIEPATLHSANDAMFVSSVSDAPRSARRPRYAVCFAGARDNYETAIALHEARALDRLVTDVYLQKNIANAMRQWGIVRSAMPRYTGELAGARIETHPMALLLQHHWVRRLLPGIRTNQAHLCKVFGRISARRDVDLFAYAGYALDAFRRADAGQAKVLFQYHPHRAMELAILEKDKSENPFDWRESEDLKDDPYDEPNAEELQLSDKVVCASNFTMRSIDWIGVDYERARVIPYGSTRRFDRSLVLKSKQSSSVCRALFVGNGIQRKGLHLLLRAWAELNCAKARLTVVWRNPEPGLVAYARSLGDDTVEFKENISSSELAKLYAESHLFLMPSLAEGFGHVILEALTAGCFTIASEGTCLPDLQPLPDYATVVPIGGVDALKRAIVIAIDRHYSGENDYEGAIEWSQKFTWRRFRDALCSYLV